MSHELPSLISGIESPRSPDYELAGSLQAVINSVAERDFSLDIQQEEALGAIGNALLEGVNAGYIEMATSTGKTTVESLLAEAAVKAGKRVLMLAPTTKVCHQLIGDNSQTPTGLTRFAQLPASAKVGSHLSAQRRDRNGNIVVSTYSGFLNDTKTGHKLMGEFDVVIADECHRSLGMQTSQALKTAFPDALKIGFSATPDYATDRMSDEVYDKSLYSFSLLEAVESGKTAPVRAFVYETDDTIKLVDPRKEFADKELAPLIDNAERNGTAVALAKAFVAEGRQGIIACIPGGANLHARLLAGVLKSEGVRATDIGGHLSPEEERLRLKLFANGTFDVLTFTKSLEEGWDSDRASFALNLTPTTSPVRTKQILGRILRKKPDGLDSIYVDFVDAKTGVNKSQYTAMHALDIDHIDFERVLGNYTPRNQVSSIPKMLHYLTPKLRKRLIDSQGKLLKDVSISIQTDPIIQEWERRLADEGMPSDLSHNDVLSAKLQKRLSRAYSVFYRDNGTEPSLGELKEYLNKLSGPEEAALAHFALRVTLDPLEEIDRETIPDNTDVHADVTQLLLAEQLSAVIDTLSEREAGVIKRRFGLMKQTDQDWVEGIDKEDFMELSEIGKIYGVQRERIRQIESKALSKLRHPSRSKVLEGYLPGIDSSEPQSEVVTFERPRTNLRPKIDSSNKYVSQFDVFEVVEPPSPLRLEEYVMTNAERKENPWKTDDTMVRPFYWRSVVDARAALGIKKSTREAFTTQINSIDSAIIQFQRAVDRLYDLPLSTHEKATDQRLATIEVYESRITYLNEIRAQVVELMAFHEQNNDIVE